MRTTILFAFAVVLLAFPALAKEPAAGATTYFLYEGYMSPQQQGGEESDANKAVAGALGLTSNGKSIPREQRPSRGWGQIRFSRDLTKAHVDVEITGVNPEDIIMFHIHCGPPGVLGPIIVNFGSYGELPKLLANGKLSVDVLNKDITFVTHAPKGLKLAPPESCPIDKGFPTQAMTVSSLDYLARKGVLYFNLHTKANVYYGEMRGQIYPSTP